MGAFLEWTPKGAAKKTLRFDVVISESHQYNTKATEHQVEQGADITDHVRKELDKLTLQVYVSNEPLTSDDMSLSSRPLSAVAWVKVGSKQVKLDTPQWKAPFSLTPGGLTNAIGGAVQGVINAITGGGGDKEYSKDVGLYAVGKQEGVYLAYQFEKTTNYFRNAMFDLRLIQADAQLIDVVTSTNTFTNMILEEIQLNRDKGTGTSGNISLTFKQIRVVNSETTKAPQPLASEIRAQKKETKTQDPTQAPPPKTKPDDLLRRVTGNKGLLDSALSALFGQ